MWADTTDVRPTMAPGAPRLGVSWIPHGVLAALGGQDADAAPHRVLAQAIEGLGVDLAFVPSELPYALETAALLVERSIAVGWAVPGPLSVAAARVGWGTLLRDGALSAHELNARLVEALPATLEAVRRAPCAGAACVVLADDLIADKEWLITPSVAHALLMPLYAQVVASAGLLGLPVLFHSDGAVQDLYGQLRRAGVAGVHMTLSGERFWSAAKRARACGLAVVGGIPVASLQDAGTAGLAARLERRCAEVPGVLLCDDGGVASPAHLETLGALYRSLRERGWERCEQPVA